MLFSTREKFGLFLKSCILLFVANLLSTLYRITRLSAESILKLMCKQRENELDENSAPFQMTVLLL